MVLLIENLGAAVPRMLHEMLRKDEELKDGQTIKIENSFCFFNPEFQLFMTSELKHPQISCEESELVRLINFTISDQSLEIQLLSLIVMREKPQLEHDRSVHSQTIFGKLKGLQDLERFILENL